MATVKQAAKRTKKAAKANPATTTGTVGVLIALAGRYLGWDLQLQADVATLALVAVPVVRGIVAWWESRQAP